MLKYKYTLFVFSLLVLALACNFSANEQSNRGDDLPTFTLTAMVPTEPSLLTATQLVLPTITPSKTSLPSTQTPTATTTPVPTLMAQGPYLVYDKYTGHGPISIFDASFAGQKHIDLPNEVYIRNLNHAVSPDGKWLAFHTGTTAEPYDLTLNLLSIPDGEIFTIAKLLSDEFPENLSVVSDYYAEAGYISFDWGTLKTFVFDTAVLAFDWSPDGQFLAFAGQMEGPSSDLYVYEIQTGHLQRMTDDMRILDYISWSPNGEWLVISNSIPGMNNNGGTLHRIKFNDGIVENPPILAEGFWQDKGWFFSNLYFMGDFRSGGPYYDLRYLNVETGQITYLWSDVFEDFSVDTETGIIAVSALTSGYGLSDLELHAKDGLYFVTLEGDYQQVTDEIYWLLEYRGGHETRFLGWDGKIIVTISEIGSIETLVDKGGYDVSVSPDRQWMVMYNDFVVDLYSADDQFIRRIAKFKAEGIVWQSNSTGVFITTGQQLYYVAIPDGEPILIDQCGENDEECWFYGDHIVWLP